MNSDTIMFVQDTGHFPAPDIAATCSPGQVWVSFKLEACDELRVIRSFCPGSFTYSLAVFMFLFLLETKKEKKRKDDEQDIFYLIEWLSALWRRVLRVKSFSWSCFCEFCGDSLLESSLKLPGYLFSRW